VRLQKSTRVTAAAAAVAIVHAVEGAAAKAAAGKMAVRMAVQCKLHFKNEWPAGQDHARTLLYTCDF
jgi:hypothetical protein